jgi:glycosyltransferase involved in cell wall biosynthesis
LGPVDPVAQSRSQPPPRILHLVAAFDEADAAALRLAPLIAALGGKAEHAIVSDNKERRGLGRLLPKSARISWPRFPPLAGSKLPGRLLKLAAAMRGYDLICTWGAGALDAAFAHTLFADVHKLAPLVHHEVSADPSELGGRARAWYRRFALGRTAALVVPTRELEALALGAWDQPRTRVRLIPEGIDTRAFAAPAKRDLLPGLIKRREELWLGTLADALSSEAPALLRALADLPPEWQLVIAGEPGARATLEEQASALGIEDRLHIVFAPPARAGLLALFDLLVLPAPQPVHRQPAVEAMAAGIPLVAPRDSEAGMVLASENGPLLFAPGEADGLARALNRLATRDDERRRIGQANREKARAEFDARHMAERFWAVYAGLTGRSARAEP